MFSFARTLPKALSRTLPAVFFALALGAAFWRVPANEAPAFVAPGAPGSRTLPALFAVDRIVEADLPRGAPSLTQLPDGRLAVAFLAARPGEREDSAIWFATLGKEGWSEPLAIASRETTAGASFANVRQLETPLIHAEGGWLHLWYIASAGGRSLFHSISTDGGRHWSAAERQALSPLTGIGNRLSGGVIALSDGGFGLTVAPDFFTARGAWLRLSAQGRLIDKARMAADGPSRSPATLTLDERHALAITDHAGKMQMIQTENAGQLWQAAPAPPALGAMPPWSAIRLANGLLLLAGNPASGRDTLQLWHSTDNGQSWQTSRIIETAADGGAEFTDPCLLQARDGRIHLAYRWRGQAIRHAVFSEAWLDGAPQ